MLSIQGKRKLATAVLFIFTIPASLSSAQPDGRGRPQGPPPEATKACADRAEGDSCSFSGPRGDVEGSCIVVFVDKKALACAPAGGPVAAADGPERRLINDSQ